MEKGWVHQVDDNWTVAMNGRQVPIELKPEGAMRITLEPFECGIWWNGWLAGIVNPKDGAIAAHPEGANEDRLIADLEEAIRYAKEGPK
jgi:hypothetical protein